MTAREYLEQAREINRSINAKLAHEYELYTLNLKMTASYDSQKVNGTGDMHPIEQIALLRADINFEVDRLVDIKREITGMIHKVKTFRSREILEYRYLSCLDWPDIADRMGYSEYHVSHDLHYQAIQDFEAIFHLNPPCQVL